MAKGDISAKARLPLYLSALPATYTDVQRASKLAREAADANDALGMIVRATASSTATSKLPTPSTKPARWHARHRPPARPVVASNSTRYSWPTRDIWGQTRFIRDLFEYSKGLMMPFDLANKSNETVRQPSSLA
jgi:hypothetical protein